MCKRFCSDEFIMEYVGDVLSPSQFKKRAKEFARRDVRHFYFMALTTERCIDASHRGNISRFINHSCDPNAETQKWTVNGEVRVGFFSKRRIRRGEEVTFDYKYERYGQEAQKCFCESSNCRGWLGGEPDRKSDDEEDEDEEGDEWSTSSSEEELGEEGEDTSLKPVGRKTEVPAIIEKALPKIVTSKSPSDAEDKTPELPTDRDSDSDGAAMAMEEEEKVVKRKRRRRVKQRSPRKIKNYEKDEGGEELEALKLTGVRTRRHITELVRLMVRSTDNGTRLTLLGLALEADLPCRRLFVDYRGLYLLHGWMESLGWSGEDLEVKLAIEDVLDCLNIPNKSVLKDSKVLQEVAMWAEISNADEEKTYVEKQSRLAEEAKMAEEAKAAEEANKKTNSPTTLSSSKDSLSRRSSQSNTRSQTPNQEHSASPG